VAQLYVYTYFEYAYACKKPTYTYAPKTLTQKWQEQKTEQKPKTINLTTYHALNDETKKI